MGQRAIHSPNRMGRHALLKAGKQNKKSRDTITAFVYVPGAAPDLNEFYPDLRDFCVLRDIVKLP